MVRKYLQACYEAYVANKTKSNTVQVHVHVHVATGAQKDYPREVSWQRKRFREVPSDSPAPI